MNQTGGRGIGFRPEGERFERRVLPSSGVPAFLNNPPGFQVIRPNTPVLPFAATTKFASFVDTSARVLNGAHVVIGQKTLVAPYATLDATSGFIKIGSNSDIQDNSRIVSNPDRIPHSPESVVIGDGVVVGFGATVLGPSVIGAFGSASNPTSIGPNALIDGATVEPGAIVGALARVGPGVTVPKGFRVLPGANVTTNAEASDPALGKVVKVTSADLNTVNKDLTNSAALAAGYTTLYQGNSATGPSPGTTTPGVFNGNLAAVEGASQEPGSPTVSFEPAGSQGPKFPAPFRPLLEGTMSGFRARVVGAVVFHQRAFEVAHHLGRSNAIRADQGQPITIDSIAQTGNAVTINSPLGGLTSSTATTTNGQVNIGQNFVANDGAVILGGPTVVTNLGDNVTIGAGAVVSQSTIGSNATVGPRAYVANSTVPAGATVPAGEILINNKVVGFVQW
jgi:carbonic anhydrase/acetyltransferase-like protein (isoleucine patch superfamily)